MRMISKKLIAQHTGGFAQTNAYLTKIGNSTVLIDAPDGTIDWLKKLGEKPDILFLTHHHFDHTMDAATVKEDYDVEIFAHSKFSQNLTVAELFSAFSGQQIKVNDFTVDHVLGSDRTQVELGGTLLGLSHVPGHSDDSLCLYDAEQGTLFAGDTLMAGSMGRADLPGGSQQLLVEGIREKILTLPAETVVYSGHGPSTTVGAEKSNPFLY